MTCPRRAVFVDRDGTINQDEGYTHRVEDFVFLPKAISGLRNLHDMGYQIFVITNQSGIARGYYTMEQVDRLHQWVSSELLKSGVVVEEFLVCPHHPKYTGPCDCRKPGNKLIEEALARKDIQRNLSWMIGDRFSDMQAAYRSRLRFIGIGEDPSDEFGKDATVARSLYEASDIIYECDQLKLG